MATRASTHNGRAGKKGAYSARHNDRDFDTSQTDHIDPTLTPKNENIRFGGDFGAATNEEHELAFYAAHFGESLDRKNAAYKAKGKAGQIKTMEQYYRSVKSCPEETLYTVGKDIDPQLLWKIYREHQAWKAQEFPQCQTLNAALHVDEPNAMTHIHERSVWIGHDAQGMEVVGQAKALAEMGVLPPDPEAKYGKYNNAKQTYTRICREHFIDLCREHGLEIVVDPLPPDKVGLELTEYKIQHAQERLEDATQRAAEAEHKLSQAEAKVQVQEAQIEAQRAEISELRASLSGLQEVQADVAACDIPTAPVPLRRDKIVVDATDLARLQEQAQAYVASRTHLSDLEQQLRAEAEVRSFELDQRKKNLDAQERLLARREIDTRADWDDLARAQNKLKEDAKNYHAAVSELNRKISEVNERTDLVRELEDRNQTVHADLAAAKEKITELTRENQSLKEQLATLTASIEERILEATRPLKEALAAMTEQARGAYLSLTNVVKAAGMLKYDKSDGYGVKGLTPKQGRLIDAMANYAAAWAEKDGHADLAADMRQHIDISSGIEKEVKKLSKEQDRGGYGDG